MDVNYPHKQLALFDAKKFSNPQLTLFDVEAFRVKPPQTKRKRRKRKSCPDLAREEIKNLSKEFLLFP